LEKVEAAGVWIAVVRKEYRRLVSAGGGGGIMACLSLRLEGRDVSFGLKGRRKSDARKGREERGMEVNV